MRDDRPAKLLQRTPVPQDHRDLLLHLAEQVDEDVAAAGKELQSEFGKEHVALIVGCNQFVRFYRDGNHAGQVEVWLDGDHAKGVEAEWGPALGGAVFQMFGWRSLNPTTDPQAAMAAVAAATKRVL